MSRESSLLFSLRELRQIEDDRVEDERAVEVARRRREDEARRLAAEEARRLAADEARRRDEEARRRDEELAARRREAELESRLRVAEAAVRQAELAAEDAVRREVTARGEAAAAGRWPMGVKVLLALLALAVIGEGAWISQRDGRRVAVADTDGPVASGAGSVDCPSAGVSVATPAIPAVPEAVKPTPPVPPPGDGRKVVKVVDPPTVHEWKPKCVCADPLDPLCCI